MYLNLPNFVVMRACLYKIVLVFVILIVVEIPQYLHAQQFVPVAKGSKVEFKLTSHKDGDEVVKGRLAGLKGKITFDPKTLNTASFDITIGSGSVNTGKAALDNTIKKESFFNAIKYPVIHFKSTSVTQDIPGSIVYVLQGNLTIKGITKPAKIQFMATPTGDAYLFRGSLEMSRLAFNIGTNDDKLDDNVSVFIEVRTAKNK